MSTQVSLILLVVLVAGLLVWLGFGRARSRSEAFARGMRGRSEAELAQIFEDHAARCLLFFARPEAAKDVGAFNRSLETLLAAVVERDAQLGRPAGPGARHRWRLALQEDLQGAAKRNRVDLEAGRNARAVARQTETFRSLFER